MNTSLLAIIYIWVVLNLIMLLRHSYADIKISIIEGFYYFRKPKKTRYILIRFLRFSAGFILRLPMIIASFIFYYALKIVAWLVNSLILILNEAENIRKIKEKRREE